jgi:hypothetical protein
VSPSFLVKKASFHDVSTALALSGWRGIRTPGEVTPTPVFKTGALNQTQPSIHVFFDWEPGPRSISKHLPTEALGHALGCFPAQANLRADSTRSKPNARPPQLPTLIVEPGALASPLRTAPMITRSEVGEYGCWAFVPGCFRCRDRPVNPIFDLIRRSSRPDAAFQRFSLAKHGRSRPGKPLDPTVYPTSRSPSPFAHTLNGSLSHSVAHFRGLHSRESTKETGGTHARHPDPLHRLPARFVTSLTRQRRGLVPFEVR